MILSYFRMTKKKLVVKLEINFITSLNKLSFGFTSYKKFNFLYKQL